MEMKKGLEYKLQNIALNVDNLDEIDFPALNQRIIEKHGGVTKFTLSDLTSNIEAIEKLKIEVDAKIKHEEAVIENIKHFHPHIVEMSEQDLLTAWMYKESTGNHKMYSEKMEEVNSALNEDKDQLKEILAQIPELEEVIIKNAE
jgi:seryl-tRNA synthetase